MRLARLITLAILLLCGASHAATGKVIKVLPLFLDHQGRVALSPSLFERDAYQARLAKKPELRAGLRYAVQWKVKGGAWGPLKLRIELLGTAEGNLPRKQVIETTVQPKKWLSNWTNFELTGQEYTKFGEVTAWRVTLWEGEELLGEQKSFLW